jgi:hypothetical protein
MGCEQAGHCNPAASGWRAAVRPRLRRSFASEPRRGVGDATAGRVPGSRMWQCGQCSGPASRLRRHSGQVMVGTLQCISSAALARRDADASLKNRTGCQRQRRVESASAANSGGLGRVLRAMDTRDAVLAEIEQVSAFGVSKMRTDPFSTGRRRQTPAPTAASGTSAGWTAIGVAAYCAEVATCDGRSTVRRKSRLSTPLGACRSNRV